MNPLFNSKSSLKVIQACPELRRRGGDKRARKTVQIVRLGASTEANTVALIKWNWNKQVGLSMVEVLVTLVILMVGLLGLAGLQMQGLRSEMESYQRVQALVLLQDMVGRINANRGNRDQAGCSANTDQAALSACEWTAITVSIQNYIATDIGVGTATGCTASGQARDICAWSNALKGAGETEAGGASVGAMIGGRGCIRQVSANANQITLEISVAWQGMGKSFQAEDTCGQGKYGDDDTLRRVVSLTTRIANLGAP